MAHVAARSVRQSTDPACHDFPHVVVGTAMVAVEESGQEVLTLTAVTKSGGQDQARQLIALLREALFGVQLCLSDGRQAALRVTYSDTFRAADWRRTYGVLRVKAALSAGQPQPAQDAA